jgi:Zn finger protein HypA/HybF involved in hydrogenase expression
MNSQASCLCHLCNGQITFESSRAGETVTCPHCNSETLLFIPKSAIKNKTISKHGGIERNLDLLSSFLIITYIVCLLVGFIATHPFGSPPQNDSVALGYVGLSLIYGGGVVVFTCVLLKAASETIRLLKKLNGLDYDGEISKPEIRILCSCSLCSGEFSAIDTITACPHCSAIFRDSPTKS